MSEPEDFRDHPTQFPLCSHKETEAPISGAACQGPLSEATFHARGGIQRAETSFPPHHVFSLPFMLRNLPSGGPRKAAPDFPVQTCS